MVERRAEKSRYITEGITAIADAFGFPRFFLSIVLVLTLQYFDAEIYRESREKVYFFHEFPFISAANFGNLVLRVSLLLSSHKIE